MKNKTLLFLVIIALIFNNGCQKDESVTENVSQRFSVPSVEKARDHFNSKSNLTTRFNELFRSSSGRTPEADWERSKTKYYKDVEEESLNILYTPLYIDTSNNIKAFIGTAEEGGIIESKIFVLLYDINNTFEAFSGHLLIYHLEGDLQVVQRYTNGIQVELNDNTTSNRLNTDNPNCDEPPLLELFEFIIWSFHCKMNPLGEVNLINNTNLDPGDTSNGGIDFSQTNVININPLTSENESSSGNMIQTQWWTSNTIEPHGLSIMRALELPHAELPEAQWLLNEATLEQLQAIADYLNNNRVKDKDAPPSEFEDTGFNQNQMTEIKQEAIDLVIDLLAFLNNNPNTILNYNSNETSIDNTIWIIENYLMESPDIPIIDMALYLSNFNSNESATITIYVDQPIANSEEIINDVELDVGHAFLSIQQGNNIRSYGFYPAEGVGILEPVQGVMGDNSNTHYDVSLVLNISPEQLAEIITTSIEISTGNYDLLDYNCTDFILEIANILNIDFGDVETYIGLGDISNPGLLGQVIREMLNNPEWSGNPYGGQSPSNN